MSQFQLNYTRPHLSSEFYMNFKLCEFCEFNMNFKPPKYAVAYILSVPFRLENSFIVEWTLHIIYTLACMLNPDLSTV